MTGTSTQQREPLHCAVPSSTEYGWRRPDQLNSLIRDVLVGDLTVAEALEAATAILVAASGGDASVATLMIDPGGQRPGWIGYGNRAWVFAHILPGCGISYTRNGHAAQPPSAALQVTWLSAIARREGLVRVSDVANLPPEADADRREYQERGVAAVIGVTLIAEGHTFGSLSVSRATPGDWDETFAEQLLLLGAALGSRCFIEQHHADVAAAVARADEARATQQRFFAALGHELRTPLSVVIGGAELLVDDLTDLGLHELAADATNLLAAANHQCGVVDELMSFVRLRAVSEAGPARAKLLAAAEDARHWMAATAGDRDVSITVGPVEDVDVACSPTLLRQLLINLVSNAVNYNRQGGTVTVAAERTSDRQRVRITVTDSGYGLSPEDLAEIWHPFVRIPQPDGRTVPGTGLGLPLTRTLVERCGGLIGAESTVGVGTTFWLDLPCA